MRCGLYFEKHRTAGVWVLFFFFKRGCWCTDIYLSLKDNRIYNCESCCCLIKIFNHHQKYLCYQTVPCGYSDLETTVLGWRPEVRYDLLRSLWCLVSGLFFTQKYRGRPLWSQEHSGFVQSVALVWACLHQEGQNQKRVLFWLQCGQNGAENRVEGIASILWSLWYGKDTCEAIFYRALGNSLSRRHLVWGKRLLNLSREMGSSCVSGQIFSLWNGIVAIVDAKMLGNDVSVGKEYHSVMYSTLEAEGVMGK